MLKAIKIRLYPNKEQEIYINKLLGSYRFVYNQCLDRKIKTYTNNKINLGLKDLGNYFHQELTKNNEYDWLSEHNTKVLKQSTTPLTKSFVSPNKPNQKEHHHENQSASRHGSELGQVYWLPHLFRYL